MSDEGYLLGHDELRRLVKQVRDAENAPTSRLQPVSGVPAVEGVSFLAKLAATLSYGGKADVTIWAGKPLADTGVTVKGEDWFLKAGQTMGPGTKVHVKWFSGALYVVGAGCAASTSTST